MAKTLKSQLALDFAKQKDQRVGRENHWYVTIEQLEKILEAMDRRALFVARATAIQFENDDEIRKEAREMFNKKWLESQKGV